VSTSTDDMLRRARGRIRRVGPHELDGVVHEGGLVVDIRPEAQRREEGSFPGAVVVERNVLEWRLDPTGAHRIPEVRDLDQPVVVVCSEGYASSLAAASLADLGFRRAADLVGGYRAWQRWYAARPAAPASR
jgi:rhodanese-related sulfurtransferase